MAEILKGGPVAAALNAETAALAAALEKRGVHPTLAVVRVGQRGDDIAYEQSILKRCEQAGVRVRLVTLPGDCAEPDLIAELKALNGDGAVHGVLLFRPLPKGMDDDKVRNTLAPEKDVDGITDAALAGVFTGKLAGYAPCTAAACMEMLAHYGYDCTGRRAVVVGRSLTVGKPAAMLLLARNATVTLCHTRTADLPKTCRAAEILIVSAGRAGVVDESCLAPGQVVLDVGVNVDENGGMCGDVDFAAAERIVGAVTPVPGGVGAVTTSLLVRNVALAAQKGG